MIKNAKNQKRITQRNVVKAVVKPYGSESYKVFEGKRYTIVEGELTGGCGGVDRNVFRYCPMKWSDNKKPLSPAERRAVFKAVGRFLDSKSIRWKFSSFGREIRRKS